MVENGLKAYGYEPDPFVTKVFDTYRKTHNAGVFDAYTPTMRAARKVGIITGLPDAYGRGRIIGDYRRVALYGTDRLTEAKRAERALLDARPSTAEVVRDRENSPSRSGHWESWRRWPRPTAVTSPGPRPPRTRPFSGSTSASSPR